jgi:hypothetical protein
MSIRRRQQRIQEQEKLATAIADTDKLAHTVLQQMMPVAIELDPTAETPVWDAVNVSHQWLYPKHARRTIERFHLCGFASDVIKALSTARKCNSDNKYLASQCRDLSDIARRVSDTAQQLSTTVCHHNRA